MRKEPLRSTGLDIAPTSGLVSGGLLLSPAKDHRALHLLLNSITGSKAFGGDFKHSSARVTRLRLGMS